MEKNTAGNDNQIVSRTNEPEVENNAAKTNKLSQKKSTDKPLPKKNVTRTNNRPSQAAGESSKTKTAGESRKNTNKSTVNNATEKSTVAKKPTGKKNVENNNNNKSASNPNSTAVKTPKTIDVRTKKFNTKSNTRKNTSSKDGSIAIIPLGGLGEIGKNMTAIKFGNNIIVVDGGMSFPDDELLGIDLVIPDYNYLLENKAMVKGIFVTHGHEDHIGALPYILKDLNVPVYGGRLAMGLLKGKLKERRMNNVKLHSAKPKDVITMGQFKVEFIRVSHSIPDSMALAIHTPLGTILHTGDFKLDMSPVDNQVMDFARLTALGAEGVLLLMSDSTNVELSGFVPSESSVGESLNSIFFNANGRIFLTTFASNVHRIQQAIWSAERCGRKVAIVGRGMTNVVTIASELGYLDVQPDTFVDISRVNSMPDNKIVIITTGSQGESLAALTRMSQDEHRQIKFRPGDLVVISASAIPGNEKTVAKTVDNLYRHGVEVVYGRGMGIHVSGHASKEDLKLMFNMIKPQYFMPLHGEYRMLHQHAKLALQMGIPEENIFILENGQVLEVNPKSGVISGKVHSGRILIDGLGVGDVGTTVLKDRKQLSNDGIVIVNLVMDKETNRLMNDPHIVSRGFIYEKEDDLLFSESEQKVLKIVDSFMGKSYNMSAVKNNIKNALGKYFYEQTARRPIILPIVIEV